MTHLKKAGIIALIASMQLICLAAAFLMVRQPLQVTPIVILILFGPTIVCRFVTTIRSIRNAHLVSKIVQLSELQVMCLEAIRDGSTSKYQVADAVARRLGYFPGEYGSDLSKFRDAKLITAAVYNIRITDLGLQAIQSKSYQTTTWRAQ